MKHRKYKIYEQFKDCKIKIDGSKMAEAIKGFSSVGRAAGKAGSKVLDSIDALSYAYISMIDIGIKRDLRKKIPIEELFVRYGKHKTITVMRKLFGNDLIIWQKERL